MEQKQTGAVVDGKYTILTSLAHGGMGEVYLARHVHLRENRVLKILREDLSGDETAQKRFLREARLATQIKHPNVAILHDFSQLPNGSFYMVWEHIEGTDVGTWIADRGPFPLLPALQLGIQTLRGLEAIHASGVVHRDISPDNLMLTRDSGERSVVKIIDLGLAKNLAGDPGMEVTQAGTFMGKLRYCSPEQAETEDSFHLDRRSDLYSFALVLYEMICGLPPQEAKSPHSLIVKRLTEAPIRLSGRNPRIDVPPKLDEILAKALQKDRDRRFPTAIDFIGALEEVMSPLRGVVTQAIPIQTGKPSSGAPNGDRAPRESRKREESKELSKAERKDLLAQIDLAAKRQRERTASQLSRADRLIVEGRFEEARAQIAGLEERDSSLESLGSLKSRLGEAEARDQAGREHELEEMYRGYIKNGQLAMAELGLQTLLEANREHPKRADFESWLAILREEVTQREEIAGLVDQAREAIEAEDFKLARKRLQKARQIDSADEQVTEVEDLVASAEERGRQGEEQAEATEDLETALRDRDVVAAGIGVARLEKLGASRTSLDLYRTRIEETRAVMGLEARGRKIEERFKACRAAADWLGAREAALELESTTGSAARAAAMREEIDRQEAAQRRDLAVGEGLQQIESSLARNEPDQAELALKILSRVAPDHPRRRQIEKRIKALRKSLA